MVTKNSTFVKVFTQRSIIEQVPLYDNTDVSRVTLSRSRTGDSNPRWREQVKRRVNATTSMSGTDQVLLEYIPANMVRIIPFGTTAIPPQTGFRDLVRRAEGAIPLPSWASLPKLSSVKADSIAKARLYAALRQQKAQMQAITVAGELPQTIREIRHMSLAFAERFAAHRRLAHSTVARWIGSWRVDKWGNPYLDPYLNRNWSTKLPKNWQSILSDMWLSFSFGIRPLVKDVQDLAETAARWKAEKEFGRKLVSGKIRGYGEDSGNVFSTGASAAQFNSIKYFSTERTWTTVKVIYRAAIIPGYVNPVEGSAYRLWQLLGAYDLENWIPSLWNLLPWSFLIDYFTNVADVCTAMVTDTSSVAWTNKSVIWETHHAESGRLDLSRETVVGPDGKTYLVQQGGNFGSYHAITRSVERTIDTINGPPQLTFSLPTGGFQLANILALISGQPRSPLR